MLSGLLIVYTSFKVFEVYTLLFNFVFIFTAAIKKVFFLLISFVSMKTIVRLSGQLNNNFATQRHVRLQERSIPLLA